VANTAHGAGTFGRVNARADRFPLVDSLRAIAALSILVLHAAIIGGAVRPGADLSTVVARLDIGVPIFFVISGFLLYRPFVAARVAERPPPAVRAYAWRRFLRIVPGYWVALTVIALVLGLSDVFTARGIAAYYGFLQLYSSDTAAGGITQAWTLCVEVTFYIALPLLALAVRRLARGRGGVAADLWLIGGLSAASLAFNAVVAYGGLGKAITYAPVPLLSALPASFFFFGLGMLLAVATVVLANREAEPPRVVALVERWPSLAWLVALCAFAVAAKVCARGGPFNDLSASHWMARQVLYAVVAVAFVLPAALGDPARGLVRRLLANRVLLFLGLVSYGVYLWHLGVMLQFADWGLGNHVLIHPYVHWALLGGAATVAIASLSYYLVERPALSLRRLVPAPRPEPALRPEAIAEPAPAVPPVVNG
jgi:peptidoglycan/LPS O-acetylase OafA/YrhL